ncbi:MAG: hypothetical protein CVT60_02725 [Actinobacteria bacterium HGW-Actinobacteria-10]|jgi:heat shock protein HslJ|nr:MAG: hypothetical protein CVT60_02725 [Actinobacteria bacterium HGW-Actinobacteria-10]
MRTIARAGSLALAISLSLALAGCVAPQEPRADLIEGTWMLESFGGSEGLSPSDPAVPTEITLDEGEAQGSGGVNSFVAAYTAEDGGTLAFDAIQATEMAGPPQAMEQESRFFEALSDVRRFESDGVKLVLSDSGNNTLVVLVPK